MDNAKRIINFKKLHEMIQDKRLKPIEKALLVDLLLYAGVDGQAFPSHKTLANDLVCSPRYISTCLSVLFARGWLKDWQRRGYGKSNIYFFNEELYFNNDISNRNPSSTHLSTTLPNKTGTTPPPNVTQLNKSNSEKVANKSFKIIFPKSFEPNNEVEVAALEAWKALEPNNDLAFMPTYLGAIKKGLPTSMFYQFVSEIKQDPTIEHKGKVFNTKVTEYLTKKEVR